MRCRLPLARVGNPRVFFSRLGYHAERNGSYAARVGGGQFPRFHAYLEVQGQDVLVNLHLDAKAPTYQGTSAHAGEYDGEVVEREIARIQQAVA